MQSFACKAADGAERDDRTRPTAGHSQTVSPVGRPLGQWAGVPGRC